MNDEPKALCRGVQEGAVVKERAVPLVQERNAERDGHCSECNSQARGAS